MGTVALSRRPTRLFCMVLLPTAWAPRGPGSPHSLQASLRWPLAMGLHTEGDRVWALSASESWPPLTGHGSVHRTREASLRLDTAPGSPRLPALSPEGEGALPAQMAV